MAFENKSLIIKQCKEANFFTLLADSTTDIAHLEQMAILLRYVKIDPQSEQIVVIKESFIGFYNMNKGDAESMCSFMVKTLFEDIGLNKSFMVGQGFDGANVMSGKHGGLQAKIIEYLGEEIYAPYIHCAAHQLNLVLVHAAENNASASIKIFFATLQKIYNYFSKSHYRWKLFLNQTKMSSHTMISILGENEVDSETSDKLTSSISNTNKNSTKTLKSLSTTQWAARLHAVEAMLQNFSTVLKCLDIISSEYQASGEDILSSQSLINLMNWQFYLNLLWWYDVLKIINVAQIIFQKIDIDMFLASKSMECALNKLKLMRSEKYYNDLIIRAKENWEKLGLLDNEFLETRIRRVKCMPGEVARDIGHSIREQHWLVII